MSRRRPSKAADGASRRGSLLPDGSGQPSPFAVVTLADAVRVQCRNRDTRAATERSLGELMVAVNAVLDPFERLSMIVIADGPWTVANGLVTPTLKMRRGLLEERYQQKIDEWRAQDALVVWESNPMRAAGVPASSAPDPAGAGRVTVA